ncbi:MAG: hypothetical protein HN370_07120 [Phycisphaerales bacterium]|jgi:hypothetical protein|nr:hypothetical protein [Phycisphaerales bacterium]
MKLMTTPRLVAALCVAALTCPVLAQDSDNPLAERAALAAKNARAALSAKPTLLNNWDDFLHYINTANVTKAESDGQAILDSGTKPKELYLLTIERPRTLETLQRASKIKALKPLATKFLKSIEKGYIAWRSDPTEIENSIRMIGGSLRGLEVGKRRLKESGEYAIPLLVQYLLKTDTPAMLRQRIILSLPGMGHQAVRAYSAALLSKDTKIVEIMASTLGELEYPAALPRLREALLRKDLPASAVNAVRIAIKNCSPSRVSLASTPAASLFYQQAVKYYNKDDSLQPDARFPRAFVWDWKTGTGLIQTPVPNEILCDIYAMRMARLALKYNAKLSSAVPVWLCALSRRELYLPSGKTDPLWGSNKPKAAFYRLSASPQYLLQALTRAMKDADVPLVKAIITSLGKTTGASALTKPLPCGTQPLVDALLYPERTVQYLAAETLATAMPTKHFPGSNSVIPILASAIRQRGKKYCLLVTNDQTNRNTLKAAIRDAGYEVVEASDLSKLIVTATQAPGVDVVVTGPAVEHDAVTRLMRPSLTFAYTPILACKATPQARAFARKDGKMVLLAPGNLSSAAVAKGLAAVVKIAVGKPLPEGKAIAWAIRATNAIAETGKRPTIYNTKRALGSLVGASNNEYEPDLQIAAAKALATINSPSAQQAIIRLALRADETEVRIAACKAATSSIQRFANMAKRAQTDALVDMIASPKGGKLYEASAQLLGAMNLSSDQAKSLILKSK